MDIFMSFQIKYRDFGLLESNSGRTLNKSNLGFALNRNNSGGFIELFEIIENEFLSLKEM